MVVELVFLKKFLGPKIFKIFPRGGLSGGTEGGSSFTQRCVTKAGTLIKPGGLWLLKHHTGSRSSSLNSFNSHFLDHSTHLITLWRDRKVRRTELQERHTTTLCHTIHVSFQRSLDSHCVATFRYLSIMIWWFCCPSWMSSSDPLDLTTPFLIWVQVPQIPLKAYDSGPGCVKSWLRGWDMDSRGVYKIYHSMFEVTFPPIPNHPIISYPIILGSGMEHEEQGFMDLRLIPEIDPQKHCVFNSMYQLQLESYHLKTCSPTVEERITHVIAVIPSHFSSDSQFSQKRGSLLDTLPASTMWHTLWTSYFQHLAPSLSSHLYNTELSQHWPSFMMIPLEPGMIPPKSSYISWHHRDPLRFLCELRITHMIQIKVLLKEGLSTSRHIPLHESDSILLCQLVIFVINELPSSIQAVGEVARNLNQVSDRDLDRKKLMKCRIFNLHMLLSSQSGYFLYHNSLHWNCPGTDVHPIPAEVPVQAKHS